MITNEYLDQIIPVAIRAPDWEGLIVSAGLERSARPAITRP